jgi:hypothetical protein
LFAGVFIFLTAAEISKVCCSPFIGNIRHTLQVKRVVPLLIKTKRVLHVSYRDLMSYWSWQKLKQNMYFLFLTGI